VVYGGVMRPVTPNVEASPDATQLAALKQVALLVISRL